MSSAHIDVLYSSSAEAIKDYCHALAQELGLTLEALQWGDAGEINPDHVKDPYNLTISVSKPFQADPQFWYTREEVLGYATGNTKAAIQNELRQDLETRLRDDV